MQLVKNSKGGRSVVWEKFLFIGHESELKEHACLMPEIGISSW